MKIRMWRSCLLLVLMSNQLFAQNANEGNWTIRYNRPLVQKDVEVSTSPDGFSFKLRKVDPDEQFVYLHLSLDQPIKGLSFKYQSTGDASNMPISLLDAAANVLWHFDGSDGSQENEELQNLKVRGQIVFRIGKNKSVEVSGGLSHVISELRLTEDNSKPITEADGFIFVDDMTEFRSYASLDNVKIRLKAGPYKIDKAYCTRFVEFSGNNSQYDMKGVSIMVDTKLFSQKNLARGNSEKSLYCALEISGKNNSMEGLYIETYGDHPGHQSKNKIFNLVGKNITLRNAEIRTAGSAPWGYGSFYGLGGGDVRKMNGIRIGYPADGVKVIGCYVHMRAMGHAIFVQGAQNTLIDDCHVDGLLRTTDDILSETSGYAFDRDFKARRGGYIEGPIVAADGKFLSGEMFSLSEDGIRVYSNTSPGHMTGSTVIQNCTVTNMRRGICTGLNDVGDKVINCEVTNCIAAGFNVGNADTLVNCRADAKYSEAFCIPYTDSSGAFVDAEILDSRNGMKNKLLLKINGKDHTINIKSGDSSYIPEEMAIKMSTTESYGGPWDGANPKAINITLKNQTNAKVIVLPGTENLEIDSNGDIIDKSKIQGSRKRK